MRVTSVVLCVTATCTQQKRIRGLPTETRTERPSRVERVSLRTAKAVVVARLASLKAADARIVTLLS